ncbi:MULTISPECIES: hypothetical protein [unclassified Sphingobacterium]|uniref:hypothetical protein n=1 Tax=unclassified Sphingobacterium TaxID=2609468 RepID=UPI0025DCB65F|nr:MULTISPECIES: hypothetical protein [unclassified Sphingobacterium]
MMIKKVVAPKISYGGVMYSHDFQLWCTYLKRRIEKGWNVRYGLIQQNGLVVRNRKEEHATFN